jgi:hypothetical protein
MIRRILLIAGNTLRNIFDKRALYIWGAAIVLVLLRSAPSLLMDGDETSRAMSRALAVAGALDAWSWLCIASAIFLGSGTVATEITSKTLITVLARPIARWEVAAGKWLGLTAFCYLSMAIGVAFAFAGASYVGLGLDGRVLALALAHSAAAIAVYGAASVALSATASSGLAASLTVLLVVVPAVVTSLEHDTSNTRRLIGRIVGAATPPGYEDHYIRVPNLPDAALQRSAALRRSRAPVDASEQRKTLAETTAFAVIYLFAGCVVFGRRDVRI